MILRNAKTVVSNDALAGSILIDCASISHVEHTLRHIYLHIMYRGVSRLISRPTRVSPLRRIDLDASPLARSMTTSLLVEPNRTGHTRNVAVVNVYSSQIASFSHNVPVNGPNDSSAGKLRQSSANCIYLVFPMTILLENTLSMRVTHHALRFHCCISPSSPF
jgi:hypothetical protein